MVEAKTSRFSGRMRIAICASCWVLLLPPASASHAPLFSENTPLVLELEAPFHLLVRDRIGASDYRSGTLRYATTGDDTVALPVRVRTRGKTRRRTDFCAFPPLRLKFEPGATGHTIFDGQGSLKLVTHCRDNDRYDQLVLQEYLAYRVYNLLTDYSHRVRLVRVGYRNGARNVTTRNGILLEGWREVAARNGVTAAEVDGAVNIDKLSHSDLNRVAVFQYLIGNEDWSALWPEPKENCCHNTKPLLTDDGLVIPLPYDFDFAGIVNAKYAVPKPPNTNVRRRRYRGLCQTQASLDETLALFRAKREEIYALYRNQPGMTDRRRRSTLAYLDAFYDVINDPRRVERKLIRNCKVD